MTKSKIGNTDLISEVNSRLILNAVRLLQPTYRAEVSRKTGLKPATVTSIVATLMDKQLLHEIPGVVDQTARFGRPPLMLAINADAFRVLAIDLEPDKIRVALTDMLARPIVFNQQAIDRFDTPENILRQVVSLARAAIQRVPRKLLLGVGVSLPGLIDRNDRVLLSSTNMPQWKNVPVGAILERELGIPVRIDRSLHLAAMHEKWQEPNIQDKNVLVISLRTGVGGCLISRGQLYTGSGGMAGEIGHTVVDIRGNPCECGSRGCLETFVSAPAIIERAKSIIAAGAAPALAQAVANGRTLHPELIYELAARGDAPSGEIVREVGTYLGIAISNLINLLAPDEIVICGAIDIAEDLLLSAIRARVKLSALPRLLGATLIRTATERERLPLLGAAVLIVQDLFELPQLKHAAVSSLDALARDARRTPGATTPA